MIEYSLPIKIAAASGFESIFSFNSVGNALNEGQLCFSLQLFIFGDVKGEIDVPEEVMV